MKRLKRLMPVLELAESRERQAAQSLGESRQKLEAAQQNLSSLMTFRDIYSTQFQRSGNGGFASRQLMEYRLFFAKINAAIADQGKIVQAAQAEHDRRRSDWELARKRSLGIRKALEHTLREENCLEKKKQQAEQDERAGRRSNSSFLTGFT